MNKLKQVMHGVQEMYYRSKYRSYQRFLHNRSMMPKVINTHDTLDALINGKKSISRFGDGEFVWIQQQSRGSFQKNSPELANRLLEVLHSNNPNVLICIPDVFTSVHRFTTSSRLYWERELALEGRQWINFLQLEREYYDTQVTRPYMDLSDKSAAKDIFNQFSAVWFERNVLIVEGAMTKFGVGNNLLSGANSVNRIICPPTNAFDLYDEILKQTVKYATRMADTLVLIALGPTATILAYDLQDLYQIQSIDVGHLDIEYSWFLQGAKEKVGVKGKYVNESKEKLTHGIDSHDNQERLYMTQIVHQVLNG